MRPPSRCKPLLVAAWLAAACGPAAHAQTFKYWSWAPGCDTQDMGSTTLCWTDDVASASQPSLRPGARPGATSWVAIANDSASVRPLTFASGSLAISRMILQGNAAAARINMTGGELSMSDDFFIGSALSDNLRGPGEFDQAGGTVRVGILRIGTMNGVASSYEIRGGRVTANLAHVGFVRGIGADVDSPGILRIGGSAFAELAAVNVSAMGKLEVRGGELHVSNLAIAQASSSSLTGGLIEITGTGSVWAGGPFAYGGGLGLDTPTLRLAAGASLDIRGRLDVGQFGQGVLVVDAGARLTTGDAVLGKGFFLARGDGRARVDGPGASWTNTGTLDIGVAGTGDLQVLRGGKVVSRHSYLGRTDDPNVTIGRNTALVSGDGALWRSDDTLTIGGGDTAAGQGSDVGVAASGRLEAGGRLRVWGGSTLQVGMGGTAAARTLLAEGGSLVTLNGGRLLTTHGAQVAGTLRFLDGESSSVEGAVALSPGGRLEVGATHARFQGPVSTAAGSLVTLRDGSLSADAGLQVDGTLRILAGGSSDIHGAVTLGRNGPGRLEVGYSQVHFWGPLTVAGALSPDTGRVESATIHNDGELFIHDRLLLQVVNPFTGSGAKYLHGTLDLSPGSAHTVVDQGALALMPGSVVEMDLASLNSDRYETRSWLQLGGTLKLRPLLGLLDQQAGARYTLFAGQLMGSFDHVDTSAFPLLPGLAWDFSQLGSAGVVGIVAVPEPGTWALMLAGLAVMGRLARRQRA